MPEPYMTGSLTWFTRDSSWWAFDFVDNFADLKFSYMIKDIIDPSLADVYLTKYCTEHANYVVSEWWKLSEYLIVKYNDGYSNIPQVAKGVGYPAWWLKEVGFGPIEKPK